MISVEQALDLILSNISVLQEEEIPILESLGQVLAEDIYSNINVPPKDNSALDGYALRYEDIIGASQSNPKYLKVIGMVIAGAIPNRKVEKGIAIRIMTGATMPEGADCVIGFEDTDENQQALCSSTIPKIIGVMVEEEFGANIRKTGESISKGALVLSKGTVIRPGVIGVLASLGISRIKVIRRPVVAIVATGNEVTSINEDLKEGKIYNSNSYSVSAQIMRDGGIPKMLGIARDNAFSIVNKIRKASDADILITIGGVSMGDYDIVKDVLSKQGEIVFWKVRSKPGKPLAFGKIKSQENGSYIPHLGLAGNAVSCMVNYELFVRPAILKMMGITNLEKPTIEAIMEDSISNKDGRRVFARVIVSQRDNTYYAKLTGPQGSGILTSMSLANGLAIVPEDVSKIKTGDKLKVMMLDWYQDFHD